MRDEERYIRISVLKLVVRAVSRILSKRNGGGQDLNFVKKRFTYVMMHPVMQRTMRLLPTFTPHHVVRRGAISILLSFCHLSLDEFSFCFFVFGREGSPIGINGLTKESEFKTTTSRYVGANGVP